MPQLDKFSFATQIFWFCLLFTIYYLILINKFLPNLLKILRFRIQSLNNISRGVRNFLSEELLTRTSYVNLLKINVHLTQNFTLQTQKIYINWLQFQQFI